jgi:hypothetical protein
MVAVVKRTLYQKVSKADLGNTPLALPPIANSRSAAFTPLHRSYSKGSALPSGNLFWQTL